MAEAGNTEHALPAGLVPICAIGASAGGVPALQSLFRHMPVDLGLAYVVIVHLAPDQPSALTEIITACTPMPVLQVSDSPTLKPNCVYVIPPDRELVIEGDNVTARPFREPRGQRAPIDMFFRSIAAARGDGIALVLSGAGADGAIGVRSIKEAGGVVMVQEPAEAVFPSMPQHAIATGAADFVSPVERLAAQIQEVAHSKEAVRSLDTDGTANDLRRVVAFLRSRTGHDFSGYKRATVLRRVSRRMQVCRVDTVAAYVDHLYTTPEEARLLFADFLISVTSFFRDPQAFASLGRRVVKALLDEHAVDDTDGVRIWTVGCATGEEPYSLAMLLLEEAQQRRRTVPIQIFATDLDEGALATAREGRYPRTIEADVSEARLARFFIDEGTHYRVRKEVRDTVLFATHSVLKEPPFMRLDLITCRNLLIYLERSLQQQIASIFHYGLKPGRFLFLGSAETTDMSSELFTTIDREARIYATRPRALQLLPLLPQFAVPARFEDGEQALPIVRADQRGLPGALHLAALEESAPPSALIDNEHNILHLSASAGRFLLHSAGPLSNLLPTVVRPELRLDLRVALARAIEQGESTLTHATAVVFDGERRMVALHVMPVPKSERTQMRALVFFLDGGAGTVGEASDDDLLSDARPQEVRRLHGELKAAQDALIASRSGHDGSIQDLRAANEELQSMNEEYRSTAEELETSKEELQSINEELHTVNAELKSKLESISVAHSDLENLTAATEIGTLFLASDLRIKMFTPPIADFFNITRTDIGRFITDFTRQLEYDRLEEDVRQVLRDLTPIEREIRSFDGKWYVVRVRPYRTVDDRIDGTVVTFVDITDRLKAEAALNKSEQQLRTLVRASSQVLYRMNPAWGEMRELFGGGLLSNTDEPRETWLDHYIPSTDRKRVVEVIEEAIEQRGIFDLEHRVRRIDGTVGWVHSRAIPLFDREGNIIEWFGSAADVTVRRRAEDALKESEDRMRVLVEGVPQLVWRAADGGRWTWSSPQWHDYTGLSETESSGLGWLAAVHPDDRDRVMTAWHDAVAVLAFQVECRIGNLETKVYRWFQARATPLIDANGHVIEWLGTSTDVDDLRRLQDSQAVMVSELQHRTRNLIAVVRSVANQTLSTVETLDTFGDKFSDRMGALSRVQGLLSRADREPITIGALVRSELDALGAATMPGRVHVGGPEVALRNSTVQTLALALHELATNAVKYGALTRPDGTLSVTWKSHKPDKDGTRLLLDWTEAGTTPDMSDKQGSGYGRQLIEQALPYALGARTHYELHENGVRCSIDLPLAGRVDRRA